MTPAYQITELLGEIVVFATCNDGVRRMERLKTRKAAADAIRVARSKGCQDINVIHVPLRRIAEALENKPPEHNCCEHAQEVGECSEGCCTRYQCKVCGQRWTHEWPQ